MTKLRVVSVCVIRSQKFSSSKKIQLTPWDLQLLTVDPIQKGLFFRKPNPEQPKELAKSSSEIINRLKVSLSDTLNHFPLLAGRLIASKNSDGTSSFFVDCNNEGAEFNYVTAPDLTVDDILEQTYVPKIVKYFFPLNGVCNYEGVSKPLLAVQVTELVDGFFIGCTINHCVADGTSFWHFFNCWSEIARSGDSNLIVNKPPVLDRWFPEFVASPIHVPLSNEHVHDEFDLPLLEERVFHFSKENIAQLKAKANSEYGNDQKICISSLQAVLAHIWHEHLLLRETESASKKQKVLAGAGESEKTHIPTLADRSGLANAKDVVDASLATKADEEDHEDADGELTLAERVEALRERVENDLAAEISRAEAADAVEAASGSRVAGANERPDASSLSSLLEQALQSKDNAMLEYCLRTRDAKVIANTIKRVSSVKVLELLDILVLKFEKSPGRCARLCPWIRSILLHHTAYLMTQPDLVQSLSALYQILENRLKVHDALQKLSGRLSLVIGQIHEASYNHTQANEGADALEGEGPRAKIVYKEEDETDRAEDEDDDDDDEDEDADDDQTTVANGHGDDEDDFDMDEEDDDEE